jgi:hypothetical protein
MAEVELIVDALVTGAAAGISSTTSSAIRDAYAGFRDTVRRHLSSRGRGEEAVLATDDAANAEWRDQLRTVLAASDIGGQPEIVLSARSLLDMLVALGAPQVDASGAKGVIVGDYAVQVNKF